MSLRELLEVAGVEERLVLAGSVGFLAFHGGLEGGTEQVATEAAASCGASLYAVVQPPTVRWHVPSHLVGADPSPGLSAFIEHVDVAIAVHGHGRPDRRHQVLLGGRNRALAHDLGDALRPRMPQWMIVDDLDAIPVTMRGLHADNPVNHPRQHGVQIELPPGPRGSSGRWMDDNSACTPDPKLIEGLAAVAAARMAGA